MSSATGKVQQRGSNVGDNTVFIQLATSAQYYELDLTSEGGKDARDVVRDAYVMGWEITILGTGSQGLHWEAVSQVYVNPPV